MVSYDKFKELFWGMPKNSEYEIYFDNTSETYVIIKYADSVSFQRCGYSKEMIKEHELETNYLGSEEHYYKSIDELVNAELIDGINIVRDWHKITDIVVNNTLSLKSDMEEIKEIYLNNK